MNLTKIATGSALTIAGIAAGAAIMAALPAGAAPAPHAPASYSPASGSAVPSSVPASPVVARPAAPPPGTQQISGPVGRVTAVSTTWTEVRPPYPSCLTAGDTIELPAGATGPTTCAPTPGR